MQNINTFTKSQCVEFLGSKNILVSKAEAKPVRVRDVDAAIRNAKVTHLTAKPMPEKVFGEPRKAEDVTPARAGTKRALIIDALHKGCTIADLVIVTGWNRSVCQSALTTDVVKGNGLGVRRDASGVLHLILPKGMVRPPIVEADETRAAAVSAACK